MSLSLFGSGSQNLNAAAGEVVVATDPNGGVWMAYVDLTNLTAGETFVASFYSTVLSGGTKRRHKKSSSYTGVQADPTIAELGPIVSTEVGELRLQQTAGATLRAYPWKLVQVGQVRGVAAEGTQAATVGVEHTLATISYGGTFLLTVDAGAMAASDTLQLRLKTKADGTNARTTRYSTQSNDQDPDILDLGPVAVNDYVQATLKQTAGTGRSFPWKLVRLG